MRKTKITFHWILVTMALAIFALDSSTSHAAPAGLTYQGRIVQPNGQPLESSSVQFTVKISSPGAEACTLFEETHTLNLSGSDGVFSINVGSGTRSGDDVGLTLAQVLTNTGSRTGLTCASGSSYAPVSTDTRKMYVSFNDGSGLVAFSSPYVIRSVPWALETDAIAGFQVTNLCRIADAGVPQTVAALTSANFTELTALIGGTSSQYMKSSATGANLPVFSSAPGSPTQGQIWFNSTTGNVEFNDGTTTQVLNLPSDVGTGANNIVQLDSSARLPAVDGSALTSLSAGNISSGTLSAARLPASVVLDGGNTVSSAMQVGSASGSSQNLQLVTNGTARLTVTSSGNIGVGTTAPGQALDVTGSANVSAGYYVGGGIALARPGGSTLQVNNTSSAFNLALYAGSSQATPSVYIQNSTGNVGVGTTIPATALDVSGKATIRASSAIGGGSDAAPDLTVSNTTSSATFGWYPSMLVINTTPTQQDGTSAFNRSGLAVRSGNGSVSALLYTSYETGGTGSIVSFGSSTNHPLTFFSNSAERMRIDTTGNVGIGTTSPTRGKVEVQQTSDSASGGVAITNSAISGSLRMWVDTSTNSRIDSGSAAQNALVINGSGTGNVGIGTSSPAAALDVNGDVYTSGAFRAVSGGGTPIRIYAGSSSHGRIQIGTAGGSLDFTSTGAATLMTLSNSGNLAIGNLTAVNKLDVNGAVAIGTFAGTAAPSNGLIVDGNVGIGTTTPGYKLDVYGSSGSTVAHFSDGTQQCSITPSVAGNISCSSDARLKKDITPFDNVISLENILQLNTVTYRWKIGDEELHTGYIAQEVEKVAPEFVITGKDGMKQVSYVGFIPWITGAIKAIYAKVTGHDVQLQDLESQNAAIRIENAELKAEIQALKSRQAKDMAVIRQKLGIPQ